MKTGLLSLFLSAALLGTAALPATAQTRRIAHRSHGGAAVGPMHAGPDDNFGLPSRPDPPPAKAKPAKADSSATPKKDSLKTTSPAKPSPARRPKGAQRSRARAAKK